MLPSPANCQKRVRPNAPVGPASSPTCSSLTCSHSGTRHSGEGRRRCCLVAALCTFAARCRCADPRVGFVALRTVLGARPATTMSASLVKALSRLRNCERCSEAVTVITPSTSRFSNRRSKISRWLSVNASEVATFQDSSALLSVVLTCCPPGPDERENRQPSSEAGIVRVGEISRSMGQALHVGAGLPSRAVPRHDVSEQVCSQR